jgi:predicted Kef-type K+ transport protein
MEPNPILFRDLTYIFLASVIGGLLAWRLRLPLILGFVVGGIAISPFTPGPQLSDLHTFEVFAEVGVVLLMMLLLIIIGKFLVWTAVVWLFRYPIWTATAVAAGLTQIGKLSFVVAQVGRSSGMVAENVFGALIAASLVSIFLNVFIVRGVFKLLSRRLPVVDQASGATAACVEQP